MIFARRLMDIWNISCSQALAPVSADPKVAYSLARAWRSCWCSIACAFVISKPFMSVFLERYWRGYFPNLPSYSRLITLMKRAIVPMTLFTQLHSGERTVIDSSCLPVCHLKRSKRHKTPDAIGTIRPCTCVGWFCGLKLPVMTNERGELRAFKLTQGNRTDKQTSLFIAAWMRRISLWW